MRRPEFNDVSAGLMAGDHRAALRFTQHLEVSTADPRRTNSDNRLAGPELKDLGSL